jgi:chemotaxis protein MotB
MARKKEKAPEGAPEWMATYSDLVTLLLCFFIMLFAMSTVDKSTYTEIAASLSNSLLNLNGGDSILPYNGNSIITVDFANFKKSQEAEQQTEKYVEDAEDMVVDAQQNIEDKRIDDAKSKVRDTVKDKGISDRVQVVEEKDFLLIRLDSEVFFESGSAKIGNEGMKVLSSLAATLKNVDNEIMVSGHTDNIPISNSEFSSNWELSTARATNVVTYLLNVEKLNPQQFTATGNGEFRPIADNKTAEGRQKNRRIEIRIIK